MDSDDSEMSWMLRELETGADPAVIFSQFDYGADRKRVAQLRPFTDTPYYDESGFPVLPLGQDLAYKMGVLRGTLSAVDDLEDHLPPAVHQSYHDWRNHRLADWVEDDEACAESVEPRFYG